MHRHLPPRTAAALTKTLGCLAPEVHGIQTHSALRGSHVQSYVEPVRDVVVHALLKASAEFWRKIVSKTSLKCCKLYHQEGEKTPHRTGKVFTNHPSDKEFREYRKNYRKNGI